MFKRARQVKQARFAPGDRVRVASRETIRATLDPENKLQGCLFMRQMYDYCGQEFQVIQVVHNVYMGKFLRLRAPYYILEGLRCHGVVEEFPHQCDRTCNLLWHEAWLEAVPERRQEPA